MAQVTAPVILDTTGQQIVTALNNLGDKVKPTADQIKRTSSNNQTVEDAIVSLNSKIVYLSHYNGNNVTIVLPNYSTALCTALVSGVGSSAFAIYRSGNSITFHHIAGHDAVTNSLSATVVSNTSATISTTGTNIQLTTVLSNLA